MFALVESQLAGTRVEILGGTIKRAHRLTRQQFKRALRLGNATTTIKVSTQAHSIKVRLRSPKHTQTTQERAAKWGVDSNLQYMVCSEVFYT